MFVYTIIPKHVAITLLLGIYTLLHKKINKKIYTIDDTIENKVWLIIGWNLLERRICDKINVRTFKARTVSVCMNVWMLEKCYIPPVYTV